MICIIILSQSIILAIPNFEDDYSDDSIVYKINKSLSIDNDKFIVERLIMDDKDIYIEYKLITFEKGWTFPDSAITLINSKGKELQGRGSFSSGKIWGEQGVLKYDCDIKDGETIIVRFEWYDRKSDLLIHLSKEGVTH